MNITSIVKLALKEDIAKGDITTDTLIPKSLQKTARFIAEENGVICGLDVAKMVFKQIDRNIVFIKKVKDGQQVKNRRVIAVLKGRTRTILSGERTALNFLQHLSGIATLTRKYVDIVAQSPSRSVTGVYDTRKTTPLLRNLEKYAVRCGGGYNHRANLSDMVLIKDNHLKTIKNLKLKIKNFPKNKKIEIECQNLKQVKEITALKPDIIMLDNMKLGEMKKSIKYIRENSDCQIEISGNVGLKNLRKIADIKPDRISIGKITHSAPVLDISLEF